ncbi:MAG: hypothetical protein LBT96_05460 [Campylobacteraceae bacterium]|jgi:hypothetical protein|nr:hypothetical protein [Campylobacteraceae bacterium]
MKEQVKYLMTLLNITTESEAIIKDIIAEISSLRDVIAFITFAKKNFDGYSFYPPYQKFLKILDEYKKVEDEAYFQFQIKEKLEIYKGHAEKIYEKIISNQNAIEKGKGDDCFSSFEKSLLPSRIKDLLLYKYYGKDTFIDVVLNRQEKILRDKFVENKQPKELTFNFGSDKKLGFTKLLELLQKEIEENEETMAS